MRRFAVIVSGLLVAACINNKWVIKNPPQACAAMCNGWGMDVAAIVGVGQQERDESEGATACVCRPRPTAATPAATALAPEEYEAAGYAAIPPEIRQREAAAAQQQQQSTTTRR